MKTNDDIILKAENLYFSYDAETSHSLNGLSLEIRRGQKIAFMGANGSGKSTFFLCCTGIHHFISWCNFELSAHIFDFFCACP